VDRPITGDAVRRPPAVDLLTAAVAAAAAVGQFLLILELLAQSTDRHRTKHVLVCWGYAMYTPMLIAGCEAIFEAETSNVPKYI